MSHVTIEGSGDAERMSESIRILLVMRMSCIENHLHPSVSDIPPLVSLMC